MLQSGASLHNFQWKLRDLADANRNNNFCPSRFTGDTVEKEKEREKMALTKNYSNREGGEMA